jgi:gamma-glutamyltranspeptidase
MAVGVASGALAASSDVSPTPFGIPTNKITNPSASIAAVRGDRMWFWTQQTRSEVLARHGIVATSQPLAAQAGLQILKQGGNAADAAVATAAMLGLVEPQSAGIGGDMEAIYYSAKNHRLYGLNAAGWAPASATPQFYRQKGLHSVPPYGVFSVTVPRGGGLPTSAHHPCSGVAPILQLIATSLSALRRAREGLVQELPRMRNYAKYSHCGQGEYGEQHQLTTR